MSDSIALYGIIAFFVVVGFSIPFVYDAFGQASTDVSIDNLEADISQSSLTTGLAVLFSVFSIFFWTFGALPLWIDVIIFVPLRIMLGILVYRNIRGIGG